MSGANRYQVRRDRTHDGERSQRGMCRGCTLVRHSPFGQSWDLNLARVPRVRLRSLSRRSGLNQSSSITRRIRTSRLPT